MPAYLARMTDPAPVTLIERKEAARRLGVCPRTIARYGAAGLLDDRRVGPPLVRVTAESVDALMKSGPPSLVSPDGSVPRLPL